MAVPLTDDGLSVGVRHLGARLQHRVVRAEAHRAAFVGYLALVVHEVNHRIRCRRVEFRRIGIAHAKHVASELHSHHLHAETETKTRHAMFACELGGTNLSFNASRSETTRNHDAVKARHAIVSQEAFHFFCLHPDNLHFGFVVETSVAQRFGNRQIGVVQVNVLSDQTDANRRGRFFNASHQRLPWCKIDVALDAQRIAHHNVEPFVVQDQRQLVDVADVGSVDDIAHGHVTLTRDLALQTFRQRLIAATHDDVGLNAAAAQLGDAVLSRLGLLLTARANERHQGDMDVTDVVAAHFVAPLTNRFKKRQNLDVADGSANFGDHHVDIVGSDALNSTLDLVSDMRNHLHGAPEIVAATLGGQHRLIDASCRRV